MMARATRSTTADLKRKRSPERVENTDNVDSTPKKSSKIEDDGPKETEIDCSSILSILEAEDQQDLLSRVFQQFSLRSLLSTPTPVSALKSAVNHLRPISSSRAKPSQAAAQQQHFCNLALSLIEQVSPPTDHLQSSEISIPSSPQRTQHRYALIQHLPSGDWWTSSSASTSDLASLQTGNAELVAILPTPSTSANKLVTTLDTYCPNVIVEKKNHIVPISTGAFLDYGPYSTFAPSFDQDGEVIGQRELGNVLWYRHEKKRLRKDIWRDRLNVTASITDVSTARHSVQEPELTDFNISDGELDNLLGSEDVDYIKAALKSLELGKLVQQLLERNQRALVRLVELQKQRLTKQPSSTAEEGSEEWDTGTLFLLYPGILLSDTSKAQAILDSLTLLASLRPRSSSEDSPIIIPPPSVLRKLHRTLAVEPSLGWSGTLPSGRTTALRDDSTVKIQAAPIPVTNASTITTPIPLPATTTFNYTYPYGPQQGYRPQTSSYTPYKTPQMNYYPNYTSQQPGYFPQTYATPTANQQPYGSATGQQPYAAYSWYGQYASSFQSNAGSGRGTPQPTLPQQTANIIANYGSFFNTATGAPGGTRTPAVGNTAATTPMAIYNPGGGTVPTLPLHLKNNTPVSTNGAAVHSTTYQTQMQPAT